ncbi:hypothetical protein JCM8097_007804 [Rhodosporidiobolus ruineniae]
MASSPSNATELAFAESSSSSSASPPRLASTVASYSSCDLLIVVALCAGLGVPVALFLPSFLDTVSYTFSLLLNSLFYLVTVGGSLTLLLAVVLVGEKAVRRWKREGSEGAPTSTSSSTSPSPSSSVSLGSADPDDIYGLRRARRVNRESRLDAAAEKVIDSLERTTVGGLIKRKVVRAQVRKGKRREGGGGGGAADEVVELSEMRGGRAATTAVRRTPPPLPAR